MPPEALASQVALERAVLRLSERLRTLEEAAEAAPAGAPAGFFRRLFGGG
jgi:localization factor PodJL